jgi:glycogen synthase
MIYSIKKCDYWATISESYYKEIFERQSLSGKMFSILEKNKEKSCYLSYGCNLQSFPKEETRSIYQGFNINNFRDFRNKNKKLILKEFNYDRIKTNFIDPTLFNDEGVKIYGSLDSFYEAPLLFTNLNADIFANGIDVLFNSILKLFELHKNIQIIICIKDGIKSNYIKNCIDFLSQNKYLDGRWVFIDGQINLPKFLSASDMILIPQRINSTDIEHLIAMNYGCVQIGTRYGFLDDSIPDIFDDVAKGCGFKTKIDFFTEEDANELFYNAILKALNLYQNSPSGWNLLIKNCINKNSNWDFEILEKYNKIYQDLIEK